MMAPDLAKNPDSTHRPSGKGCWVRQEPSSERLNHLWVYHYLAEHLALFQIFVGCA